MNERHERIERIATAILAGLAQREAPQGVSSSGNVALAVEQAEMLVQTVNNLPAE